jgi:hypothetical protein
LKYRARGQSPTDTTGSPSLAAKSGLGCYSTARDNVRGLCHQVTNWIAIAPLQCYGPGQRVQCSPAIAHALNASDDAWYPVHLFLQNTAALPLDSGLIGRNV